MTSTLSASMSAATSSAQPQPQPNSKKTLCAFNGFKEFAVALGMGSEGADILAKDIRRLVGPDVDDVRIRRIVDTVNEKGSAGQDPKESIPIVNELLRDGSADLYVYTLDWHPANHISFYEHCRNGDRKLSEKDRTRKLKPFDVVDFQLPEITQVLYPTHCVQKSWGSDIDPLVHVVKNAKYIRKGTEVMIDSYSAFNDNQALSKTPLEELLRSENIDTVIGCGLAYEICVAATLKDSAELGFFTAIVAPASKGLDEEKIAEANRMFEQKNIAVLDKEQALAVMQKATVPMEWVEKRVMELLGGALE